VFVGDLFDQSQISARPPVRILLAVSSFHPSVGPSAPSPGPGLALEKLENGSLWS